MSRPPAGPRRAAGAPPAELLPVSCCLSLGRRCFAKVSVTRLGRLAAGAAARARYPVDMDKRMRVIGALATVGLVVFAFTARTGTYRVAPVFLVPLLWLPYALRRRLHLHPLHYGLFAAALLLHNLGALGFYQRGVFGLSFDIYVHFYFGFVGALLVYRLLRETLPLGRWTLRVGTVLLVLGGGAIHEIVEWFSTLILGERGMLKTHG